MLAVYRAPAWRQPPVLVQGRACLLPCPACQRLVNRLFLLLKSAGAPSRRGNHIVKRMQLQYESGTHNRRKPRLVQVLGAAIPACAGFCCAGNGGCLLRLSGAVGGSAQRYNIACRSCNSCLDRMIVVSHQGKRMLGLHSIAGSWSCTSNAAGRELAATRAPAAVSDSRTWAALRRSPGFPKYAAASWGQLKPPRRVVAASLPSIGAAGLLLPRPGLAASSRDFRSPFGGRAAPPPSLGHRRRCRRR